MEYKDINTPRELYMFMKENIKYGFVNQQGIVYLRKYTSEIFYMEEFFRNYYYQKPEELLINKCGICYDQNELMKKWLIDNNYEVRTYYSTIRNHCILVYKDNNKYNWIERTFLDSLGIHDFNNLDELFNFYLYTQFDNGINEYEIYEFENIKYGISFYDYIIEAKRGKLILKK